VWREQLSAALISLGFTAKDSDVAINEVLATYAEEGIDPATADLSELLKKTLQSGRRN
jgi:Holliday junction DNA helicase RuvA